MFDINMTDVLVTGDLRVQGDTTLVGGVITVQNVFVSNFLRVGALQAVGFNILAALQVDLTATVGGSLTCNGPGTGLTVTGNADFNGEINVLNTVFGGGLSVSGDSSLNGTVTCTGGTVSMSDVVTCGAFPTSLNVTNKANVGSIGCTGTATFEQSTLCTRAIGVGLTVTAEANVGLLVCQGAATIQGSTSCNDTLFVSTTSTLTGAVTCQADLTVAGKLLRYNRGISSGAPTIVTDSQSGTVIFIDGPVTLNIPPAPSFGAVFEFFVTGAFLCSITSTPTINFVDAGGVSQTTNTITNNSLAFATVTLVFNGTSYYANTRGFS